MQINITFRHVDPSDKLKEYCLEKIERLKKYFDGIVEGHVILSQEKIRHLAEFTLSAQNIHMVAKDESSDFHSAIDGAISKIERQLTRHKEKLKGHKERNVRERRAMMERVYDYESFSSETEPKVVQTEHYMTDPRSIDEAVMEIDLTDKPFLVFTDKDGAVKVVYRRPDGNYGLIEPE